MPAIENSKDLSTYNFNELMNFFLAHEARVRKASVKGEEKVFQVKGNFSYKGKAYNFIDRGHGR